MTNESQYRFASTLISNKEVCSVCAGFGIIPKLKPQQKPNELPKYSYSDRFDTNVSFLTYAYKRKVFGCRQVINGFM